MGALSWTFLGPVDYDRSLALQEQVAAAVRRDGQSRLLLLEHPPTITRGRQAKAAPLRWSPGEYRRRGIAVRRILRGGDVTYHGPGQLVGYPIANLRRHGLTVPEWVRGHAQAIRSLLSDLGLRGDWSDTHPGVWVGGAKIAALGFRISRGVSTHGFALNVDCDLSWFTGIVPCGIRDRGVTSMTRALGRPVDIEAVRTACGEAFEEVFQVR